MSQPVDRQSAAAKECNIMFDHVEFPVGRIVESRRFFTSVFQHRPVNRLLLHMRLL